MEKEYYSNCCDAPPRDYKVVDTRDDSTGHCQNCGDGAVFYIMGGRMLNDPEISKIIDEETEKVEKEEMSKKVRSQEELIMENINLNMKIVTYEFRCKGLEYEVKTLKEKLNERSNNG